MKTIFRTLLRTGGTLAIYRALIEVDEAAHLNGKSGFAGVVKKDKALEQTSERDLKPQERNLWITQKLLLGLPFSGA